MTRTQQRGRVVLVAHIILVFSIAAILIPAFRTLQNSGFLTSLGIRLWLVGALLAWLYRGSNSARWICIALFGLAGVRDLVAMLEGGDWTALALRGIVVAGYLSFILVLLVSPAVREFLSHQRHASQIARKMVPVGKVFLLAKHTVVRPLDRLTLALPKAMLSSGETPSALITSADAAEVTISDQDDKLLIRLEAGEGIWLQKSVQAFVLPWEEGETGPKRVEFCPLQMNAA